MSSILYYSNFCEHSKKLLQGISKTQLNKDIHFICIDQRVKENNKTFIVLQNGQKIVLPENITRVPALLLLNKNYEVLYGEAINQYFKPKQESQVMEATYNNLEPMAFSIESGGFGAIVSDNYSFLDMNSEELEAKGDGGLRQMHNYVDLSYESSRIQTLEDDADPKGSNKIPQGLTIEQLQKQREDEFQKIYPKNNT